MRRAGVLLVLAGVLIGCVALGLQRSTISVDRDETLLLYADVKAGIRETVALVTADCAAKRVPAETCERLGALLAKFQGWDTWFQARVAAKEDLKLDDLRGLLESAAAIARLAGYPVPTLAR